MEIVLEKIIFSTPNKVYNSLTEPDELSFWNSTNTKAQLTVGGRYSNDNGDEGVYLELRPFEKITFTWENEQLCPHTNVEINIFLIDHETIKLSLKHSKLKSDDLEKARLHWELALESLKSYVEKGLPLNKSDWKGN